MSLLATATAPPTIVDAMAGPEPRRRRHPLDALEPEIIRGIVERLRLARLLGRFPERPVWAAFMFINGFVTIAILAGVAMLTRTPFVFPSLGPTAFLFFFSPTAPTASPRNTIIGHAIGIAYKGAAPAVEGATVELGEAGPGGVGANAEGEGAVGVKAEVQAF